MYLFEKYLFCPGELPDPNADQVMSRCGVCSEKAYVNPCGHCDKKVCDTCKEAHCDIMKREISRINNQVKRGLHRIEEALSEVERNQTLLKSNADQVVTEIDEINRRLTLALKERTDYLKSSVEKYVTNEMKSLKDLKDNLDLEITNITSNADLMEKNLDDGTKWDDIELMDCKDIFIKMMDWIRNYDTSNEEYTRRIRFTCHDTVNDLAKRILEIGDLKMQENKGGKDADEFESRSSGLSRSKSDHRLVSEFRRQEESSPPRRRAFGESRYNRDANKSRTNLNRYGGGDDEDEEPTGRSRYRSRFLRGPWPQIFLFVSKLIFSTNYFQVVAMTMMTMTEGTPDTWKRTRLPRRNATRLSTRRMPPEDPSAAASAWRTLAGSSRD